MQYDRIDRTSPRALGGALGAIMLLAACGDEIQGFPDGGPCWPIEAEPGGQAELGIGDFTFEPMPDVLTIIKNASQSDPYIQVHSRIRGIPPGDPDDFFHPHNPRTKVAAVIEEVNLRLGYECPASLGYVPASEKGAFDLVNSLRLGFGAFPVDQVSGKQALITVEVVGANRVYARAEKVVTLMTPP